MPALPFWKLKREIWRLGRQAMGAPRQTFNLLVTTYYYDLVQARQRRVLSGRIRQTDKVAVYLIFPNAGVLRSHIQALDYVIASGYAPLVVSNVPLTPADEAAILERCHEFIQRPNVGYDFGGYRDAVLHLGQRVKSLRRLVLLNDSVWFPLPGGMDWLARAEGLGVDYAAAAWAAAVKHTNPEDFERSTWVVNKSLRNFHYASYALSISDRILKNNGFLQFWKRLKLTSEKNRTVRRGEMGLTRWVVTHGFSHGATTELLDFPTYLKSLSEADLRTAFDRLISMADPEMKQFRKEFAARLTTGGATRQQVEQIIICNVARQGASYAVADLLVRKFGFAFLKKSPAGHDPETAATMRMIADDLTGEAGATIRDEMAMIRSRNANRPDAPAK